jgi:formylglycine-generating enzyme required for sulfatase activity
VGSYPSGASPYGALEMSGNVWEWTSSLFKSYPYTFSDGRELAESSEDRVLRGGSWGRRARYARAAFRYHDRPQAVYSSVGFRLARSVPNS